MKFSCTILIILVSAGILSSCDSQKNVEAKKPKPNVILILADDLGYGDIGVYNEYSLVPTPNIDTLASQGIRFTDAYCPIAICSPTRYSLLTGTYAWRSRKKHGVMRNYERSMMKDGQLTLPQMFQKSGYTTAGFGKWHLGTLFPTLDGEKPVGYGKFYEPDNGRNIDLFGEVSDGPIDHGFNHWIGFSCASECFVFKDKTIIGALEHDFYTIDETPNKESIDMIPMDDYLPYITDASLEFLKNASAKKDKPFFLYYSPYVPHVPLAVSKEFLGSTQAGPYGDYVHELDFYIGKLLKGLDNLGLSDNTIVILASDNGSAFRTSYDGMDASNAANKLPGHFIDSEGRYMAPKDLSTLDRHSPNGILRGVKRSAWEGGVRTPLIARWPGHFPEGEETDEIFSLTDVMATLAPVAGYKLDNDVTTDGLNNLSAFAGEKKNKRRSVVVKAGNDVYGLRQDNWKFIEVPRKEREPYYELYDLSKDPSETANLANEHPERVQQMKAELNKILKGNSTTF
ncbi:arylsulfatase [Gramella sp. MAR_2010_147]|uniref:sulfatase family protein n=1 Tax=Gramella sp. MAR_2010_147 TaxID=1250205 RepID=UPI00087DE133|nr:arylsulfatase [Gramella sp. MAR_2010_147]SDS64109.1 Arylsulfatase A [Gramella sp. MAR_2010_147]